MVAQKLEGLYRQRGHGIGTLVGSLFKHIVPALATGVRSLARSSTAKRVGKAAAKAAINTGLSALKDASKGQSIKSGVKANFRTAKKRLAEAALGENMVCQAKKAKRSRKTVKRKRRVKSGANSIF